MKKVMIFAVIIFSALTSTRQASAQVSFQLHVNLGSQPDWGPVGYDYVDYYYLPDCDVYYHVPTKTYVYMEGPRWVEVHTLPARYKNVNLYNTYKVVVNEPKPYLHHEKYYQQYHKYQHWGGEKQPILRDHKDYREHKDHDHKDNGNHGKGNGNGKGNKHDK